jgi:acyl-CoA thioester hydrolase
VSGSANTIEFRVRYSETDQMGVAYHANYLVWCEIGRTELMRAHGAAYSRLESAGVLLAVAEVGVRYVAAARYDELIRVTTTVQRLQSRSVTFAYHIQRIEPGPVATLATAHTRLLSVDRAFTPRILPRTVLDSFRTLVDGG